MLAAMAAGTLATSALPLAAFAAEDASSDAVIFSDEAMDAPAVGDIVQYEQNYSEQDYAKYMQLFSAEAAQDERTGIERRELYTIGNPQWEAGAGIHKGNGHDRQQLGIWVPKGTSFRIRQADTSLEQNLSLRMYNDDSQTEFQADIPKNGDWLTVTATADSVPFVQSIYRSDGKKPVVEFEPEGTRTLPVYREGDDEAKFYALWDSLNAPFAVYEAERAIFLVPICDRRANRMGTLQDLCNYYNNMISQYNAFSGLSTDANAEEWNRDSGSRFFIKADRHGAGAAYYSYAYTAQHAASMASYMSYGWLALHELGHGYDTVGFNSAEIWNNVFAYYYQLTCKDSSTWLNMTDEKRAGYERERAAKGYDKSDSFATKLYFWVDVMNKIGPQRASAYAYQKARYNNYHKISNYPGFSLYADAFTEGTGYNVVPYFDLWERDATQEVREKLAAAGVYKNIYPLVNLVEKPETAESIKAALGLESIYDLVETEKLAAYGVLTGRLNITLDEQSLASIQGKEITITDGVNTVKTVTADSASIDITLPIGVYNVLLPPPDGDGTLLLQNSVGYAVVKDTGVARYTVTAEQLSGSGFADAIITFGGWGNQYSTIRSDIENGSLHIVTNGNHPHDLFGANLHSSVAVYDNAGNQIYYKEHIGNRSGAEDASVDIAEGSRIKIYFAEPGRNTIKSAAVESISSVFADKNIVYEVTAKGLRQISPTEQTAEEVQAAYYAVLCGYLDALKEKNPKTNFQNPSKLKAEKAKINVGYAGLTEAQKTAFLARFSGYYPFDQGVTSFTIAPIADQIYTGRAICPRLQLSAGGKSLKEGVDYTVQYINNTDVGTAKAILYGLGEYADCYGEITFRIVMPQEERAFTVECGITKCEYTGGFQMPQVTVRIGDRVLRNLVDYKLSYVDNTNIGIAKIIANGMGNYAGYTGSTTFEIVRKTEELLVTCVPEKLSRTGEEIHPILIVTSSAASGFAALKEGQDFRVVAWEDNIEAGTARVRIEGMGNYIGSSGIGTFEITTPITPTEVNGSIFSNQIFTLRGIGGYQFAEMTADLEQSELRLNTRRSGVQPNGYINGKYAAVKVLDSAGSSTFYREYWGTEWTSNEQQSTPLGLGYVVELYLAEPSRSQRKHATAAGDGTSLSQNLIRFEGTSKGLKQISPAAETQEEQDAQYFERICAYMQALVDAHPKADFRDKTKLTEEKARIIKGLGLLSAQELQAFRADFAGYYPFEAAYIVLYDWGENSPARAVLPSDAKAYLTEAEARNAVDTRYTKGFALSGEKDGAAGKWIFSGWDAGVATDSTVTFSGSWTFLPDTPQNGVEKPSAIRLRSAEYRLGEQARRLDGTASVADGGKLSYQWYAAASEGDFDGRAIRGATGEDFRPDTDTAGTFYYYVVATNSNVGGTASSTSNMAVITVTRADGKDSNDRDDDSNRKNENQDSNDKESISTSSHRVHTGSSANGEILVDSTRATEGEPVTITVRAAAGYALEQLLAMDADGRLLTLTRQGEDQYTFIMPQSEVDIAPIFVEIQATEGDFADVAPTAYYYNAVRWAVAQGIAKGTSPDSFSPNASCTRAQLVTFLRRAAGNPHPMTVGIPFEDVREEDYYYEAILWALENGITAGTSPFRFSPDETVTRAQAVAFLYRVAGSPAVGGAALFSDVNEDDYFAAAVAWAQQNGITSGTGDGAFSPNAPCDRAQIVTMLYRYMQ